MAAGQRPPGPINRCPKVVSRASLRLSPSRHLDISRTTRFATSARFAPGVFFFGRPAHYAPAHEWGGSEQERRRGGERELTGVRCHRGTAVENRERGPSHRR